MKRFAWVCLLALPVLAIGDQEAKAWFKFGLGGSFNTGLEWGGLGNFSLSCQNSCCPPCYAPVHVPPAATPAKPEAYQPNLIPRRVQPVGYGMPEFVPAGYWFGDDE